MAKNRQAITCNGRPAFYASIYEDIRQCAMDCGWAVALHGSLSSDMDIMALPWTDQAATFEELVKKIQLLFDDNSIAELYSITYSEKPHGRTVATIPIWGDFYLDISTVDIRKTLQEIVERLEEKANEFRQERHRLSLAMYSEEKAYNNLKKLTQKEIGMLDAIEIVKEVGGVNE